ncbi:MAG: ArnT family glycosyltransferase [Anaerolineales bacterium]
MGKELANKNVGLLAMLLTGVSYWPNILARVALRFILYPAFAAPTLYYLVRGLRTGKRHYFILSGIFLGIGLHGYSPFRAVPVLVVIVMLMYWLEKRESSRFDRAFVWLGIVAFVSLIIFLPLLRVWTQAPELFNYRTASRLTAIEAGDQMAQGWALVGVFIKNVWDSLLMFNWNSGEIWVNTIVNTPSLEVVSGAALIIGIVLVIGRYARHGRWEDGLLLWGIPILMLPSTLSLAFPHENPAPNRAGGAMILVFILAAMGIEAVLRSVRQRTGGELGLRLAAVLGIGLMLIAAGQNYRLTFTTFPENYIPNSRDTSEMGAVIAQFTDTVGSPDQAWVVAYPHWVDTRLVGINAGFPIKDFAIWEEDLDETLLVSSPKLFLLKPDDDAGLLHLQRLYPEGKFSIYPTEYPVHSFIIFTVP